MFLSLDVIVLVSIALITGAIFHVNRSRANLPPGPPGIPLFGNLFQINVLRQHPQFLQWATQYGEVFRLKIGQQNMIILNKAEAADELLVNRSKNYSSRPSPHVANDIMSDGQRMVFMSYDREWKIARRNLQSFIGPGPSKLLRKMQEFESRVTIYDFICHGDQSIRERHVQGPNGEVPERHWFAVVRRYTTSVVLNLAYGERVPKLLGNPHLHKIYDVIGNFARVAQPGNYIADVFSIMRVLPDLLAPWRAHARKMHVWEMELWGGFLTDSLAALKKGVVRIGFVPNYLRSRAEAGLEHLPGNGVTPDGTGWMRDKMLAYTAGSILEAGSDTTAATIQAFILFMLSSPVALERARAEIDEIVGIERLPTWEDEERLPWTVACIKETMRRRPTTIMGVPHKVDQDDVYNGYDIPKGSTVIGNIWAIHMDPERYPNPTAFMPERFYKQGSPTKWASGPDSSGRDHYAFGWGRRFCQGSFMAEASLFIVLTRLLWGVDFFAPSDPITGKAILPDIDNEETTWGEGFISTARIFPVEFHPRSEKHAEVIKRSFDEVQMEWEKLGLAGDER